MPIISGGLLKPFIELQKKRKRDQNPYITRESYLATIIHEFAHIYYQQSRNWWYSDMKENLIYLQTAQNLFANKKTSLKNISVKITTPFLWSEVFAFCSEYFAANLFWPKHKENIDQENFLRIKNILVKEKEKNLDKENSILDGQEDIHLAADVLGKIIITRHPAKWPIKILKVHNI